MSINERVHTSGRFFTPELSEFLANEVAVYKDSRLEDLYIDAIPEADLAMMARLAKTHGRHFREHLSSLHDLLCYGSNGGQFLSDYGFLGRNDGRGDNDNQEFTVDIRPDQPRWESDLERGYTVPLIRFRVFSVVPPSREVDQDLYVASLSRSADRVPAQLLRSSYKYAEIKSLQMKKTSPLATYPKLHLGPGITIRQIVGSDKDRIEAVYHTLTDSGVQTLIGDRYREAEVGILDEVIKSAEGLRDNYFLSHGVGRRQLR